MNNDWLQGYLQALRTVQDAVIAQKNEAYASCSDGDMHQGELDCVESSLDNIIEFIKDHRNSYKELVEKLNEKNSKRNS